MRAFSWSVGVNWTAPQALILVAFIFIYPAGTRRWQWPSVGARPFMYGNLRRIHKTLRVTPAMEAGVTRRLWEIRDIADIAENFKTSHYPLMVIIMNSNH